MITRIELDGFKTFQNLELDLGPFEVIIGANGAGKSNLFDALRLLSRLADAESELNDAFQGMRGETDELFTIMSDNKPTNIMRIAVELLVEPKVTDKLGETIPLDYSRLRYELEVSREKTGLRRIQIVKETLAPIPINSDGWSQKYKLFDNNWIPNDTVVKEGQAFISTKKLRGKGGIVLTLHPDHSEAKKVSTARKATGTLLSSVTNTEFPHALAVREEMRKWHFLQLSPEELRGQRFFRPPLGAAKSYEIMNLRSRLTRMQARDQGLLKDVSRDLAELVPGIMQIRLEKDRAGLGYILLAQTQDGREFPWQALSDGTLRLLALATLRNDPNHSGLLCFEEPENGVHPSVLPNIARILRDLATDFSQPYSGQPLQQLLVNTHSPVFVSQSEILEVLDGLLFAYVVRRVEPDQTARPLRITRITPVRTDTVLENSASNNLQAEAYTLEQVKHYLTTTNIDQALTILAGVH